MIGYRRWIRARLRARKCEYVARLEPKLFSLVTPVYDTPPRYLRAMARSVFEQDYPEFEWVIVDNGSTDRRTRDLLAGIANDPRVRLLRLEQNTGIMGGTRHAVAYARGRYVLPVDSDDWLHSDALRVMAAALQAAGYPALAYSDEDKLLPGGRQDHPFLKPDWDPVLFFNCCYVAHLCAIDRELASALGAYEDDAAHGCHDWDTFWRFVRAGHTPLHVPEVLYSWRMHAGSTATPDATAKPYTVNCQRYVLTKHIRALGLDDRIEIRTNPLFRNVGMWQAARRRVLPQPMHVLVWARHGNWRRCLRALAECSYAHLEVYVLAPGLTQGTSEVADWNNMPGKDGMHVSLVAASGPFDSEVLDVLEGLPGDAPVALLSDGVMPLCLDWPWEALGQMELHPDAAVVGGRILNRTGTTAAAGQIFGLGGFLDTPDRERRDGDMGHYGLYISQRSVDAVAAELCVIRAGLLRDTLANPRLPRQLPMLTAWLGGLARQRSQRVIYSPHIAAQYVEGQEDRAFDATDLARFRAEFGALEPEDRYYSRHYTRDPQNGYQLRFITSPAVGNWKSAPVPA
jgi:glycosyl transferase family 2